jgi:hypothetical protein
MSDDRGVWKWLHNVVCIQSSIAFLQLVRLSKQSFVYSSLGSIRLQLRKQRPTNTRGHRRTHQTGGVHPRNAVLVAFHNLIEGGQFIFLTSVYQMAPFGILRLILPKATPHTQPWH